MLSPSLDTLLPSLSLTPLLTLPPPPLRLPPSPSETKLTAQVLAQISGQIVQEKGDGGTGNLRFLFFEAQSYLQSNANILVRLLECMFVCL